MRTIDKVAESKTVFFITFFFRSERLRHLYWVLRNIGELPCREVKIHIFTQIDDVDRLSEIENISQQVLNPNFSLIVHSVDVSDNPQSLTWAHKNTLREEFNKNKFDYYIYLEDDIRFTAANLGYFIENRDELKDRCLIPGFVRVEYHYKNNELHWADNTEIEIAYLDAGMNFVRVRDKIFVSHKFPYAAMFVFDNELCEEYFRSDASDLNNSLNLSQWGISERSAMGLTWSNIPTGFSSRIVIPVMDTSGLIYPFCLVDHLPSNYANSWRSDMLGHYRLTDSLVVAETSCTANISEADLTDRHWSFGPVGREGNGQLNFAPEGRMRGETTPNERRWELNKNVLEIFDEHNRKAWVFVFLAHSNLRAIGKSTDVIGNFSFELQAIS